MWIILWILSIITAGVVGALVYRNNAKMFEKIKGNVENFSDATKAELTKVGIKF